MTELKFIALLFTSFLLISCAGDADKSEANIKLAQMEKSEEDSGKPTKTAWELQDENCQDQSGKCSRVVVEFKFGENLSREMQVAVAGFFEQEAIASLQDYTNDSSVNNLMVLAERFLAKYMLREQDEIEADIPWYAEFNGDVIEVNEKWASVELNESSYTGGVHGYYQRAIQSFKTADQSPLDFADLNTDKETLRNEFEAVFRAKFNLADENLSDAGFWFENNAFHLNKNFALRNDSLIFIYNPYEIAAYSEGIIELGMPLDQVQKAL